MPETTRRPRFLLVHGAWHQPSCWDTLRAVLTADGWDSETVELPSSGPQDSLPTAGLFDDARVIGERVAQMEGPVVLVGHSYGGLPVTQAAAEHPHLVHVVYLAAYLPDEGQSMYDIHGLPLPDDLDVPFPLIPDPRNSLYGDLPDDAAEQAVGKLVDQTTRSCAERVTRAGWKTVPSTYIVCERDQALPPELQSTMSKHAGTVVRLATGHSPMLSAPAELAALLTGAASSVLNGS